MLKTSEVTLKAGNDVLYDRTGDIVGGLTGSSDNVPDNLRPGESYRETVTGIPAESTAARAEYAVWPD